MRYFLTLAYNGGAFAGWQIQPAKVSVQGEVERALYQLTQTKIAVVSASRTDSGVHAWGQVAHFDVEPRASWPSDPKLLRAIQFHLGTLPIQVRKIQQVSDKCHARYDAQGKTYEYLVWVGDDLCPLMLQPYVASMPASKLDIEAMKDAAAACIGRHSFDSFMASDGSQQSTQRHLESITLDKVCTLCPPVQFVFDNNLKRNYVLRFVFRGDGFLKHMVRNLVGTLLEVGRGRRGADSISALIDARDRRKAGPTAPAQGLMLREVHYDASIYG